MRRANGGPSFGQRRPLQRNFPAVVDAVFIWGQMMNITEQLECLSDAGTDPGRRCRVKCCAAACGVVTLLLVLLIGPLTGAHGALDVAHAKVTQFGSGGHE
jgi:hypothetical protein